MDSVWRNRDEFIVGQAEIVEFLRRKWSHELDYALPQGLVGLPWQPYPVRFQYESHDPSGQWFHGYGNELWEFELRMAS